MLIINIWEHSLNQAFRDQILQSSGNKSYFRRKLVLLQGRTRWNFFSTKVCPSGLPNFICKKRVTDRKSKRANTSFTLTLNPLRHVRTCQRFNKHSFLLHSCLCVSGGNTTVCYQSIPKGLQWLLAHAFPRPGRLIWRAAQQQVPVPVPSSDLSVLRCQGAGRAQVRGCSRVCALCRAPEPGEGSTKLPLYPPAEPHWLALLLHSKSSFHTEGKGGGTSMGATHSIPLSCFSKRTTGAAWLASATWL